MRNSPFFDGIRQVDIEIAGEPGRTPTFYFDASSFTAVFPARLGALRRVLPDPRYVPARLAPGVGAVAVMCLEYRETDIGPYNELAIAIVLSMPPYRANLPGRALIARERSGQTHSFVWHLPVTTEVARVGGIEAYNFPKFLADIAFAEEGGRRVCRLAEGQEHILTLSGPVLGGTPGGTAQLFNHLWMDGQPQSAEFKLNQLEVATARRPGLARIELGERHPIALELGRVLLSRSALQFEDCPRFEAVLFGPEHLTVPLLQQRLGAVEAAARR